ncbi:unnamed protein product [Gordionus sp. m RMFG-2023]
MKLLNLFVGIQIFLVSYGVLMTILNSLIPFQEAAGGNVGDANSKDSMLIFLGADARYDGCGYYGCGRRYRRPYRRYPRPYYPPYYPRPYYPPPPVYYPPPPVYYPPPYG